MLVRLVFMASWLAFVAACSEQIGVPSTPAPAQQQAGEETTPPAEPETPVFVQSEHPSVTERQAAIDWDAARTDLASTPGNAMPESFQVQSGEQAPAVPVLLPSGIVQPAGAENQPQFRQLPDGYFAHYPGVAYNITVSGTNEVYSVGGEPEDTSTARYQSTATGAIVSLTRYGAGYMVEFECKDLPGADGGDCIDEAEALEVAENLVIAGSR